jgi:hypothetical protein
MMYEENSTPEEPEKISCLNCGAQITDRFCSHCGQDKNEFQKSIWQILVGFAASLFDLDGKIPSSFVPLLFKPGKLTLEFLEGKRKSQINPFQLYAFFSFIFFLTAFYLPNFTEKGNSKFETNVKFNPTKSVEGSLKTEDQPDSSFGSQVQKVCHEAVIEFGPKGLVHHYDSVQRGLPEDCGATGAHAQVDICENPQGREGCGLQPGVAPVHRQRVRVPHHQQLD